LEIPLAQNAGKDLDIGVDGKKSAKASTVKAASKIALERILFINSPIFKIAEVQP
jgi:hypothetical protein